jgi:hypothetical protein
MDYELERPTIWDHVYFWTKEVVILASIVTVITVSLSAFFYLPENNNSSMELLTFILS